mgnify:CR=1 FL=1
MYSDIVYLLKKQQYSIREELLQNNFFPFKRTNVLTDNGLEFTNR